MPLKRYEILLPVRYNDGSPEHAKEDTMLRQEIRGKKRPRWFGLL